MNPVTYAQSLAKKHGPKKALEIAQDLVKNIELNVLAGGGTALGDEIEVKEQTEIKNGKMTTTTMTVVDNVAKDARQNKTLAFWRNVSGYIKNRPNVAQYA